MTPPRRYHRYAVAECMRRPLSGLPSPAAVGALLSQLAAAAAPLITRAGAPPVCALPEPARASGGFRSRRRIRPRHSPCKPVSVVRRRAHPILLVEDDPGDAETTLRALSRCGLGQQALWVSDGAQALDALFGTRAGGGLDTAPFRLVLLDLDLPRLGGAQVLHAIRTDERTRDIPVVIVSLTVPLADRSFGDALGGDGCVPKLLCWEQYARTLADTCKTWLGARHPPSRPVHVSIE